MAILIVGILAEFTKSLQEASGFSFVISATVEREYCSEATEVFSVLSFSRTDPTDQ